MSEIIQKSKSHQIASISAKALYNEVISAVVCWRGYKNLRPIPNPKSCGARLISELWSCMDINNLDAA
jgi:hypothetical protein